MPVPGFDYENTIRTSLTVQWLRLLAVNAGVDAGGGVDPWLKRQNYMPGSAAGGLFYF